MQKDPVVKSCLISSLPYPIFGHGTDFKVKKSIINPYERIEKSWLSESFSRDCHTIFVRNVLVCLGKLSLNRSRPGHEPQIVLKFVWGSFDFICSLKHTMQKHIKPIFLQNSSKNQKAAWRLSDLIIAWAKFLGIIAANISPAIQLFGLIKRPPTGRNWRNICDLLLKLKYCSPKSFRLTPAAFRLVINPIQYGVYHIWPLSWIDLQTQKKQHFLKKNVWSE